MLKKDARKLFKSRRLALPPREKIKLDDLLLIEFQKLPLPFISVLFSFRSLEDRNEVDPSQISRFLQFQNPGLSVAYPKTSLSEHSMQAILCDDEAVFEHNAFGIPEPVHSEVIDPGEIDLVLLPLLAFDERGHRVGYGKGIYDAYLTQCRPDCIKIGLSYFAPVPIIEDASEYDVPLNFCITPQKVYVF